MAEGEETTAPVAAAPAEKKKSLISRQLEAIRRQKTEPSTTKSKAVAPASDSTAVATSGSAAETPAADSTAPAATASATNGSAGASRVADLSKSSGAKSANKAVVRRLGLPLKGERAGVKRTPLGVGAAAKRPPGLAGRLQGFAAKAFRAAAAAAASPSKLRSDAVAPVTRKVPPVVRLPQAPSAPRLAVRKAGLRAQGPASRALAALANNVVDVEKPRRVRPRVRLPGVAGALLPVKKQEESDEEVVEKRQMRSRGMASKVITVPQPQEKRVAPVRPAPRVARGFGYGHADSDAAEEAPVVNGRGVKRPLQASRRPPARTKSRDLKNGGIVSAMLGHLNSAKRQLSDERTGIKVKEEARWEPEEEEEVAEEAPVEDEEEEDEEEEEEAPVAPPPRKRAKLRKERERQKLAKAQAVEMKALQRRLETHYSSMKNFIRTRAEPTIFYLPAKHNSETRKQLEETRSAIGHKISSLKVHLQSVGVEEASAEDSDE